jgi:hypothetical protein
VAVCALFTEALGATPGELTVLTVDDRDGIPVNDALAAIVGTAALVGVTLFVA